MSLTKLKRDLISCGKEFFIDNYIDIKEYALDRLERSELDSRIKAKEQWSTISTLGNRISAVKMIFENDQVVDALKITIESRANSVVTEKAKEYFELETGRVYNEEEDRISLAVNRDLIPEILEVIEKESIKDLCLLNEFRFQKGTDKLNEFESFDGLSIEEMKILLRHFHESGLTFTQFVESYEEQSVEFKLLTLLGEVVSYCDLHAANKKVYNEYEDKRTLGKAGVRMNDWLDKLLNYKIGNNDLSRLTPSIKNSLIFLKNPENGLTMLSENHRKKVIKELFKIDISETINIVDEFESFFEPYDIEVINEKNRNSIYCTILYDKKVADLWLNIEEPEIINSNNNNDSMSIPLNQIFYGPPGTGKTYNISNEAELIINNIEGNGALTFEEKVDRITRYIRSEFDGAIYNKLNGNNIYRNFSKSMVVWGLFLDARYDANNTIIHEELKDTEGFRKSGWSQRVKYLTEFGFIEGDWVADLSGQLGFDMTLSESGESLKSQLRSYLQENGVAETDLLNWNRNQGIPDVVRNGYLDVIRNVSPLSGNMTAFKKTILSALNMCVQGHLYKQNQESRDSTEEEIELVERYFDVNGQGNSDYKWVGWVAENLVDLNLVERIDEERNARFYYQLTETGRELMNSLIDRWEQEYSHLFGSHITYETAVQLGQIEFITFHQSYSYEEFIEGIRPSMNGEEELTYSLEKGVFKRISDRAKYDLTNNYVIIIDEINRGNISKIFGELITLIEPTKRLFTEPVEHPQKVTLPYSKRAFGVPKNLYILGTMNTADKSIALLDSALRRRFVFKEMLPNPSVVESLVEVNGIDIKSLFSLINERIEFLIDKDHTIGHSYFLKIKDAPTIFNLAKVFSDEIIPLLTEYFYGDYEKIRFVLGDNKEWNRDKNLNFITKKSNKQNRIFGTEIDGFEDKESYELSPLLGSQDASKLEKLFRSVYDKNVSLEESTEG